MITIMIIIMIEKELTATKTIDWFLKTSLQGQQLKKSRCRNPAKSIFDFYNEVTLHVFPFLLLSLYLLVT